MAIVSEGLNHKLFLTPTQNHSLVAKSIQPPPNSIHGKLGGDRRAIWTPIYGMSNIEDLFTTRQLTFLTTMVDMLEEISNLIINDAKQYVHVDRDLLKYAQAIKVYLAFIIDKISDRNSSVCSWDVSWQKLRNTFGRQGIPMAWDYAESNPFSNSTGSFNKMLEWVVKSVKNLPCSSQTIIGECVQFDAQDDCGKRDIMISTDPPYYDNIGYADLSDFFYVWLRRSLKDDFPELFKTTLVPKNEELIATSYRHNNSASEAKRFFEQGMLKTCRQIHKYSRDDIPVTIYYGYKQQDSLKNESSKSSSGWETMLSAIINSGFAITGTWPMRTEMANRLVANGTNALASSIVIVCRKRDLNASSTTRRELIKELKDELHPALTKLQSANIAPVDMAQSAIGPGMAVFSRYKEVLESDGSPMTVRSALQIINQELDSYFNEQSGTLDRGSQFCVDLYTEFAFDEVKYGDADTLARAKNISVDTLKDGGVLSAQKGIVRLLKRSELGRLSDSKGEDCLWRIAQQLTKAYEEGGIQKCAELVSLFKRDSKAERAKDLVYRLYTIANDKGWTTDAFAYNALIVAWSEIKARAVQIESEKAELVLFDKEN